MPQLLTFADFVPETELLHLARSRLSGNRDNLHTHDFAELFWVLEGRGIHCINARELPLAPGDLVFIRPSDRHDFRGSPDAPLVITNLALPADTLRTMAERYRPPLLADLQAPLPPTARLPATELARLNAAAEELLTSRDSRLELERFLLNLLHMISRSAPSPHDPAVPAWATDLLRQLAEPRHFRQGPAHLAQLTGRSHEHVARVLKRTLGLTPTELLNRTRLDYAARQLQLTDHGITSIAFDAGFGSVGHFYACFRDRYGCTPRHYRLRQQMLL